MIAHGRPIIVASHAGALRTAALPCVVVDPILTRAPSRTRTALSAARAAAGTEEGGFASTCSTSPASNAAARTTTNTTTTIAATAVLVAALALAPPAALAAAVDDAAIAATFAAKCAGCHAGGGNVLQASATLYTADLERNGYADPDALYRLIYNGKGRMPGWGADCAPRGQCTFGPRFSDDEVKGMADFVLRRAGEGWAGDEGAPAAGP